MNSITAQIEPQACDPVELQLGRAICNCPGFYYGNFHFFLYDNDWTAEHESRLGDRSHAFINYGQWPASWAAKTPWPRSKYRESITQFSKRLSELNLIFPEVQLYFLSTKYHSFSAGTKSCPATDFRFPHIIDSYNNEARESGPAQGGARRLPAGRAVRCGGRGAAGHGAHAPVALAALPAVDGSLPGPREHCAKHVPVRHPRDMAHLPRIQRRTSNACALPPTT